MKSPWKLRPVASPLAAKEGTKAAVSAGSRSSGQKRLLTKYPVHLSLDERVIAGVEDELVEELDEMDRVWAGEAKSEGRTSRKLPRLERTCIRAVSPLDVVDRVGHVRLVGCAEPHAVPFTRSKAGKRTLLKQAGTNRTAHSIAAKGRRQVSKGFWSSRARKSPLSPGN